MPSIPNSARSKPLPERSTMGIVRDFLILPGVGGSALVVWVVRLALVHGAEFSIGQWCGQIIFPALLGAALATALPLWAGENRKGVAERAMQPLERLDCGRRQPANRPTWAHSYFLCP